MSMIESLSFVAVRWEGHTYLFACMAKLLEVYFRQMLETK
jgi:hypothetical protein